MCIILAFQYIIKSVAYEGEDATIYSSMAAMFCPNDITFQ